MPVGSIMYKGIQVKSGQWSVAPVGQCTGTLASLTSLTTLLTWIPLVER